MSTEQQAIAFAEWIQEEKYQMIPGYMIWVKTPHQPDEQYTTAKLYQLFLNRQKQ